MHIGIDARIYGVSHRGIGRYTQALLLSLLARNDDIRYTVFAGNEALRDLEKRKSGKLKLIPTHVPWYGVREHLVMPRLIRESRIEHMHWPHLNVAYWCPVPYTVTIHDLIVLHFPNSRATNLSPWKYKLKLAAYRKVLNNAVKKARNIIAVSEFTKRDIVRHLKTDEKKISVIYPGVEQMVLGTERMHNSPEFSRHLGKQFNITKQYLLYVGSAYPHKNLEALVDAYQLLRTQYNRDWQLVLVGKHDAFYKKLIQYIDHSIKDAAIRKHIICTGEVSDKDLDGIYRGAKLLVFPSLYEGFGFPPLEAANRGVPIAAAKAGSLPEVLGDSAYYFNPKDVNNIAYRIDIVGGSNNLQSEFVEKGFRRARNFLWNKTAEQTSAVYTV